MARSHSHRPAAPSDLTFGIESLPAAATVCAPDGRIIAFNRAALDVWGATPSPQDQCCFHMQWLDEDGSHVGHGSCPIAAILDGRTMSARGRGLVTLPTRRVHVFDVSSAPLSAGGRLTGVLSLMHPVDDEATARYTMLEALRMSEERLKLALDAGRLGSWALDLQTNILTASVQCKANHGMAPDHQLRYEEDIIEPILPDPREGFRQLVTDTINAGGSFECEVPIVWPDGTEHWLLIAGRIVDQSCMVGVSLDVTDRKDAQHRISELNQRKDDFIATLGHELRQPLAPIAMGLTLLRTNPEPVIAARTYELMQRQLEHLTRLIDDLVDSARVAQGKVELMAHPVVLQDSLRDAANVAAPAIAQKQQHLELEIAAEPIVLVGDGARLQQVFSNLLLNASKYTESGGRVRMSAQTAGNMVFVKVRDNGRGIPTAIVPKLFDMFMQADSSTGLGIGLPVVKRLVELHGGRVDVTFTRLGVGSEFTVTLPLAQ